MENTNRGMHGDSLLMLAPTGASNRKPLPLGMGYITEGALKLARKKRRKVAKAKSRKKAKV